MAALLKEAARRFGVEDWTFVGTSEGSVSAFHAARMNPGLARRMILTASLFQASRNGPGLSKVTWDGVSARLLGCITRTILARTPPTATHSGLQKKAAALS